MAATGEDSTRPTLFQRLAYGWVVLFVASIAVVGLALWYNGESVLIPRWRASMGLLALLGGIAAVLTKKDYTVVVYGMYAGLPLLLAGLFFLWAHPLHQYALVRHVDDTGYVQSDDIYLRSAPVVKRLERGGAQTVSEGGRIYVQRYLYSPRFSMLSGNHLGDGEGRPSLNYELYGIEAWLLAIRAACEIFAFYTINLAPLLLAYGLYAERSAKPQPWALKVEARRVLLLIIPFGIGLAPFLSAIAG